MSTKVDTNIHVNIDFDIDVDDKSYTVVIYDDNITPIEYVLGVMMTVFGMNGPEACRIIDRIQQNGSGNVGQYSRAEAYARVEAINIMNNEFGFVLQCEPQAM